MVGDEVVKEVTKRRGYVAVEDRGCQWSVGPNDQLKPCSIRAECFRRRGYNNVVYSKVKLLCLFDFVLNVGFFV